MDGQRCLLSSLLVTKKGDFMQNIFLSAQKAVSLYIQNTWGFSWEGVAAGWPRDSRRDSVTFFITRW